VCVAVGQLIWSSPRPGRPDTAPTSWHPGCSLPDRQSRRPAATLVPGRNGRPPGHRAAGRQPRPGPAPGKAGALLQPGIPTCPPSARPASAARTASPGGTSPAHHRTASTEPCRQGRPRRPPDPASAPSATRPGSTGSSRIAGIASPHTYAPLGMSTAAAEICSSDRHSYPQVRRTAEYGATGRAPHAMAPARQTNQIWPTRHLTTTDALLPRSPLPRRGWMNVLAMPGRCAL
jgi:hypothetical protein